MKKVKITGTTYGYHNAYGRLEPKDRRSKPFMLDDTEADRLVLLGVAEIVTEGIATQKEVEKLVDTGDISNDKEHEDAAENVSDNDDFDEISYTERPEYSEKTKVNELREIGKNVGINFPMGTKKVEMLSKLDEFFDDYFANALDLSVEEPFG